MAKRTDKNIKWESSKRNLLLEFVSVCVLLIFAIWIQGIVTPEPKTPSYYRETYKVDESLYLTVTADALRYNPEPAGTPEPDGGSDQHHGSGQGQGGGQSGGDQGGQGSGN